MNTKENLHSVKSPTQVEFELTFYASKLNAICFNLIMEKNVKEIY